VTSERFAISAVAGDWHELMAPDWTMCHPLLLMLNNWVHRAASRHITPESAFTL